MRIRFGNQTARSAPSVLAPFHFAIENGFDAFEFFPNTQSASGGWSEQQLPVAARKTIRCAAQAHDIRLSVHARLRANPATSQGLQLVREDIQLAREFDARLLLVHLELHDGLDALVEGLLSIVDELGAAGIDLAVENTPHTGPAQCNALFDRIDAAAVQSRCGIGLCFDLGHANLCAATRNDYLRFLDELAPNVPILHVHLHENFGDRDSHLPVFTGHSASNPEGVQGWLDRMVARRYAGSVILEQWPQTPRLLVDARNRLIAMLRATAPHKGPAEPRPDSGAISDDADEQVKAIAQGDQRNPSWRQKLGWVQQYLTDARPAPDVHTLAYLAIYLRFLGTGEVCCDEDGGHVRPCHHARISARLHQRLRKLRTPENAFAIRRLLPWLPSAHESFTRAEPLTRIRDIAHRNDIPHQLKQELKNTLQDKLHRNAGPEDLRTSAALLARFMSGAEQLPARFVREFQRFHADLEEFFHARCLRAQLQALEKDAPDEHNAIQRELLACMDAAQTLEQLTHALHLVVALRGLLRARAEAGDVAETQPEAIAEIRLEEFSFTLLSRLNHRLQAQGMYLSWHVALEALVHLLEGLALGEVEPEESRAVAAELHAWRTDLDVDDRWQMLRLVASLERARRLTDTFASQVQSLFADKVEKLGKALGVQPASRKVLAEAEIQTHPVFQLARLTGTLLRQARERLQVAPWEVVVSGRAVGRLSCVETLDGLRARNEQSQVVLVDQVRGDEELPLGLVALISPHEVPHLSHLAIRARQQHVVMACAPDAAATSELRAWQGRRVVVDTSPLARAIVRQATDRDTPTVRSTWAPPPTPVPCADGAAHEDRWLPLEAATLANSGPKADASRKLLTIARAHRGAFDAPPGLVIPFGVLEAAVRADAAVGKRYDELRDQLQHARGPAAGVLAAQLRELVGRLVVPDDVVLAIQDGFHATDRLMVRSSANTEDLESFAGARLHESVPNVRPALMHNAVQVVWASLWTLRAVAGRAQQGIAQQAARMAVLIQPMIAADYAFVVHTVNPVNLDERQVVVELVLGMGETLARNDEPGTPYRMVYDTQTELVQVLAFESLSYGRWPEDGAPLERVRINHAEVRMSRDRELQRLVVRKVAMVSKTIASALEAPQDIEGVIVGGRVMVVQSRRQQGAPL